MPISSRGLGMQEIAFSARYKKREANLPFFVARFAGIRFVDESGASWYDNKRY